MTTIEKILTYIFCISVLGDDIDIMKYNQEGSGEETTEESSGREGK